MKPATIMIEAGERKKISINGVDITQSVKDISFSLSPVDYLPLVSIIIYADVHSVSVLTNEEPKEVTE